MGLALASLWRRDGVLEVVGMILLLGKAHLCSMALDKLDMWHHYSSSARCMVHYSLAQQLVYQHLHLYLLHLAVHIDNHIWLISHLSMVKDRCDGQPMGAHMLWLNYNINNILHDSEGVYQLLA